MLAQQPIPPSFTGGLDIDYLSEWHIELLKSIRFAALFVAFDTAESLKKLDKARDLLADFSLDRKRAYVLIGFNGETLSEAEERCSKIYQSGFLPFAMLYDRNNHPDWKRLQRKWARPAAYRSKKIEEQHPLFDSACPA